MPSLREHLDSPQFPGEDPPTAEDFAKPGLSLVKLTSGWVAAGQPRKKAYTIYMVSFVAGILLAIPAPGDFEIFGILGVVLILFGVFGTIETLRGKRFPRPR